MPKSTTQNHQQWENFARKDALFYIDTSAKNVQQFWGKGEINFQKYLRPLLKKHHISAQIGVDFGCGLGRHTFPLSTFFQKMYGVDISETMLKKARLETQARKIKNIEFIQNEKFLNHPRKINFFYSVNVFQHIENFVKIKAILQWLAKSLKGFAYLQFDTRPATFWYNLKNLLPDFLLPATQRRGIRRIRRDSRELRNLFLDLSFSIVEQHNKQTEHHFFLLKK